MHKQAETENAIIPEVRAMTWAEREAFIDAGLDPVYMEEKVSPAWERKVIKWILEHIYKDLDYASLSFPQCRSIAFKTYEMTVRGEAEEIKNS